MCYFCEAYGEGNRWYLNPKNYSRQLYRRREEGSGLSQFTRAYRGASISDDPLGAANDAPEFLSQALKQHWENRWKGRLSQVVAIDDALKIAEIAYPFTAMSCECRLWGRARIEDNESMYTCGGLGVGMFKWERWPERYKGGVHFLSPDEAKDWITQMNKKGYVGILMNYGGTYVGGFCFCDYPECGAIRMRVDLGVGVLKGHEVARIDYEKCNGCGVCVQRCQWGAIKFEVTIDKANIDQMACFGCSVCMTGCPREAITMIDKATTPTLKDVW